MGLILVIILLCCQAAWTFLGEIKWSQGGNEQKQRETDYTIEMNSTASQGYLCSLLNSYALEWSKMVDYENFSVDSDIEKVVEWNRYT